MTDKFVPSKYTAPQSMSFSFFQWVWAIFALLRFWDKRFHPTNEGGDTVRVYRLVAPLKTWQVLILMRVRGERPMTLEEYESIMVLRETPQSTPRTRSTDVPYLTCTDRGALKFNWGVDNEWNDPSLRFLSSHRKDL